MRAESTPNGTALIRGLGLPEATAANIVTMVGSAIFVTLPLVLSAMGGPQAALAWILGMLIALADGLVWAELGASLPGAGGTYVYLREAFGPQGWGRLWSFVYLWGAAGVMPLICAFVAVSAAQYLGFLWQGMAFWHGKSIAIAACALATALAYRNIRSVGRISMLIFVVVAITAVWIIATGLAHFDPRLALDFPPGAFAPTTAFFSGLGAATIIALFDYGGYATVCFCGGEVRKPERTIPLSIVYSIVAVRAFYLLTTIAVIGVVPWREASRSPHVVAEMIQRAHGPSAAMFLSALVVLATFGSLFTTVVGFARVLFAAAADGQFFSLFARLHPVERFPSGSTLALGAMSALLCLLPLETLLRSVAGVSALKQSIPQVVALLVIRRRRPDIPRPFRMWTYPVPALVALAGFIFVLLANEPWIILAAVVLAVAGAGVYFWRARRSRDWPFRAAV